MGLSDDLISDLETRLASYGGADRTYYDTTTDKFLKLHEVGPGPRAVKHRSPCLRVSSGGSRPLIFGVGRYFALGNDDNFYLGAILYIDVEVGREIFTRKHHQISKRERLSFDRRRTARPRSCRTDHGCGTRVDPALRRMGRGATSRMTPSSASPPEPMEPFALRRSDEQLADGSRTVQRWA